MSSFFDSASLVQIPSGYSDGTLYSVKPIDGSGDLTFSRGSDIEATRVASNGYIEKAAVNLLNHSNNFTYTWTNTRSTETSGYAGYDGTNNAWKLDEVALTGTHKIQQSITTTGIVSASIYAKSAERSAIQFLIESGGSYVGANFNLADGSVQSSFSATFTLIEAKVSSVGSGWYRLSFSANVTSSAAFTIYTLDAGFNTSYAGTTDEGIYIQDAQLNYGLVPQEYVDSPSGSSVVSGITNDMPRLDYSGGASCPSLKLEGSRTNVIPQSEYIASWYLTNATATANDIISPEGVQNATKIDAIAGGIDVKQTSISVSASTTYTYTFYCKLTSGTALEGRFYDNTNGANIEVYDYTSQLTIGEWARVERTFTTPVGCTNIQVWLLAQAGSNVTAHYYGAQLEAGSYPTSYIPTYGTSATRTADACSKTGISSLIGQTEGTLFLEYPNFDAVKDTGLIGIDDGSSSNRVLIFANGTNAITGQVLRSGTTTNITPYAVSGKVKVAIAYSATEFVFYVNGAVRFTGGAVVFSNTMSRLTFNHVNLVGSETSQTLLFPTRLSNADLATLTA